jgi:hypothetical protein
MRNKEMIARSLTNATGRVWIMSRRMEAIEIIMEAYPENEAIKTIFRVIKSEYNNAIETERNLLSALEALP